MDENSLPLREAFDAAERLAAAVAVATTSSDNESTLRHEIEQLLKRECIALSIPHLPYQLERKLGRQQKRPVFADVVHGEIIIEYKSPRLFKAGHASTKVGKAKEQVKEYAELMANEEGREISDYTLVIWDGTHIAFGNVDGEVGNWGELFAFQTTQAHHLLCLLRNRGTPIVHPGILRVQVGPESEIGATLIPVLYREITGATLPPHGNQENRTNLLFREWSRLFGQSVGISTEGLREFLRRQSTAHRTQYESNVPAYLFALHTFIALVAKVVAGLALPGVSEDIKDARIDLRDRIESLEDGTVFANAGIVNMVGGDFFSWITFDAHWQNIEHSLGALIGRLGRVSFDITKKSPRSIRDLFKGLYEEFVPRELRHALGEVYTPDWLAGHALDQMKWSAGHALLDPTCGTGTFVLEAIQRRVTKEREEGDFLSAEDLLRGLYGLDLNPLAVLAAKASIVIVLAERLTSNDRVRLPIFLADAINTATVSDDGFFVHTLPTEKGNYEFKIPAALASDKRLHEFFDTLRSHLVAGEDAASIEAGISNFIAGLSDRDRAGIQQTVQVLIELRNQNWDGIWCSILADRFAAGAIEPVSHIAGNPPWVKWSHLPPKYAEFIKPHCQELNVFSDDYYVGGIESDISTVITFEAIRKWLSHNGRLAFLITGTIFANESSQGFRRFSLDGKNQTCSVLCVEDFKAVKPFAGVSNHPALLILERGKPLSFPITYRVWQAAPSDVQISSGKEFRERVRSVDLLASPVPGTDAGPWLKGSHEEHRLWRQLFDGSNAPTYVARKGVTTDRNGIYFLEIDRARGNSNGLVHVRNDPNAGRTAGIPRISMAIEPEHIFPLLRGRGLKPFSIRPDLKYRILVPQRGMHGDERLQVNCGRTYTFLNRFKKELLRRGSYRRYQQGQPFWSTWSTGPYTFSPYKVLWKEMSGNRFCAAYFGSIDDSILGRKVAIPDHKLYMVPVNTIQEAQFLTGVLNAPSIVRAVGAYAAQLSLGTSVFKYLNIPTLDLTNPNHARIIELSACITQRGGNPTTDELDELDCLCIGSMS